MRFMMTSFESFLVLLCILALQIIGKCFALTYADSDKSSFGICLTSQDNLIDVVDPRKLFKFIDQMDAFKTELVRTKQYYQYCGNELKFEVEAFVKWIEYAITKIDTEIELSIAVTKLIHKKDKIIDGIHLEMKIEKLDEKIIEKALKEVKLSKNYLSSSEANKCVDRLKKIYEVSDEIVGKFGWLRKLYCKLFKKEDSEEKITRPTLDVWSPSYINDY